MTTPERIEKLLKDYLDKLEESDLKTFQWYLVCKRSDGYNAIPRSRLQNATREQTVDILVQVYGEDYAVETTIDILHRMNQNELANQLTQAQMDRHVEQKPSSSAARDSSITHELSCPICLCIFTSPVTLECGHSFCRICVHNHWQGNISQKCPVCQKLIQNGKPSINYVLNNLSEDYSKKSQADRSGGPRNKSYQTSSKKVKEKQKQFKEVKKFCDSTIERIEEQADKMEEEIKKAFEKICLSLEQEKETRIMALRQEKSQKICGMQKIAEMSQDTFAVSDTVKAFDETYESYLKPYRTKLKGAQKALLNTKLLPQALLNMSNHVENLMENVWKKMYSTIIVGDFESGQIPK